MLGEHLDLLEIDFYPPHYKGHAQFHIWEIPQRELRLAFDNVKCISKRTQTRHSRKSFTYRQRL